jgi:hypothetical protein
MELYAVSSQNSENSFHDLGVEELNMSLQMVLLRINADIHFIIFTNM